jgi:hypothetical protein
MPAETPNMNLIRTGTLAQVLQLVRDDEKFGYCMAGFLDDFYRETDLAARARRVADDPGLTDDPRINGRHRRAPDDPLESRYCRRRGATDRSVSWTGPWFIGPERMKGFLLAESPLAFRRRFNFTETEPPRRASMPRDGRWWAYETIRSGLMPTAEERRELDLASAPGIPAIRNLISS